MPWRRSSIFREQLSSALAPRPGWRARSGWNLPDRPTQPPPPANIGHAFRCCLFGDNVNTIDAETLNGYSTALNVGVPPGNQGPWLLSASLPSPAVVPWPNGGRIIPGTGQRLTTGGQPGFQSAGTTITFGGDNVSSDGPLTMSEVYGDLVFDEFSNASNPADPNLIAYQGLCFHFYGGPAEVTDGTFTVVWPNPERVAQIQLVGRD